MICIACQNQDFVFTKHNRERIDGFKCPCCREGVTDQSNRVAGFNFQRWPFVIFGDVIWQPAEENIHLSHRDWFWLEGWTHIDVSDVRGFVWPDHHARRRALYCYDGRYDAIVPADRLDAVINSFARSHNVAAVYNGVIIGEPGTLWEAKQTLIPFSEAA